MKSLKPNQNAKRDKPPRDVLKTSQFLKDWERLTHSGRYDLSRGKVVMMLLIGGELLGPEWRDHPLQGEYSDCRECHIGGDFLLIYKIAHESKAERIVFVRLGTHSELFK